VTEKNINTSFIHINVQTGNANLLTEIEKIKKYQVQEFDSLVFFRATSIIDDKKNWVHNYIDKQVFEELKSKEMQKVVSPEQIKENIYRDNLRFENIGMYNDLDIDFENFEKYNKGYTTVTQIEENKKEFVEEELVDYLKDILENKNDIYHKYKDEKLTENQFQDAYQDIVKDNEGLNQREPKPTHHLMIPFAIDIQPTEKKENKQFCWILWRNIFPFQQLFKVMIRIINYCFLEIYF